METCWFTSYLPDVRYQADGAMENAVGDALFWMSRFDADGVRIDAVPMTPRATTRRIVRALRDSEAPSRALFALGEVFTGEGTAGLDQIKYYLGPNGLDSAFDFPLMWTMRDVIAHDAAGFDAVEGIVAETEQALAGSGAVVPRMLDNHDTTRFISEASGDDLSDPWDDPPPEPTSASVFARHQMALALIFTLPGMPVIYYGDEVGLAGADDPDSRRVMPALDGLPPQQATTLALTQRLGVLRRCSLALRRGTRIPIWDDSLTYAFARDAGDGAPAVALFSRAQSPATVTIPGGVVPPGIWIDAVSGAAVTLDGATDVPLDPLSFKILVPAASRCHP
jgi:glycosidase